MKNNETGRQIYRDTNLLILFSVTLMAIMGVSSITPAFPKIMKDLQITPREVAYLITFFTFPGIILTPVMGMMADRLGRKRILVPSLLLFAVTGTACAYIRDYNLILLMRALQGMGAASLGSINVAVIGDIYQGRERAKAMGYNASVLSIGTGAYPAIGGALATFGWYYPFFLPILAVPVALLVLVRLKNPEPERDKNFSAYLAGAWKSINNRKVFGLFVTSIVTFILLYGSYLSFFPILLAVKFGETTLTIGLLMSFMSLSTAVTASQLGRILRLFSKTGSIRFAFILYAVALAVIPNAKNLWQIVLAIVLFGIAQGMNLPNILTLLAEQASINQRASMMSLNGMVLRIGQTVGPLLTGSIYAAWGLSSTFYFSAILALVMLVILIPTIR